MRSCRVIRKFILVAKPGILLANLVSAAGGFFLASRGEVNRPLLLAAVSGIGLVVACGCVLNNCIDRDLDRSMARTRHRAVATGCLSVQAAVCYAALLGIAGTILLWRETNPLCTTLVLVGFAVYVGAYSLVLKRRSVSATLIGSLAGAAPPVAGYCAVSNHFDMEALILLFIFSLWQIPHSYAIAIFRWQDYAAAAIPVLPIKRGTAAAKRHIVGYILAFVTATLLLSVDGYTGYRYFAAAAFMGMTWLMLACAGYRTTDDRLWAKRLMVFSILNITVLSVMMSIDVTLPGASRMVLSCVP